MVHSCTSRLIVVGGKVYSLLGQEGYGSTLVVGSGTTPVAGVGTQPS
jgi:hypothetical protein